VEMRERGLLALKARCYAQAAARASESLFELVGPEACRDDHDAIARLARDLLVEAGHSDAMGTAAEALLLMEAVERVEADELKSMLGDEVAGLVAASLLPEGSDPVFWMLDRSALGCLAEMPATSHTLRAALLLAQWRLLPDSAHHADLWWREAEQLAGADPALLEPLKQGLQASLCA